MIASSVPYLWEGSSLKMSLQTERSSSYVNVSVCVCVYVRMLLYDDHIFHIIIIIMHKFCYIPACTHS